MTRVTAESILPATEVVLDNRTATTLTVTFPSVVSLAAGDVLAYELQYKAITSHEWSIASSSIEDINNNHQKEAQILSIRVDEGQSINEGSYFVLGMQRMGGLSSGINQRRDVVGKCLHTHTYPLYIYVNVPK